MSLRFNSVEVKGHVPLGQEGYDNPEDPSGDVHVIHVLDDESVGDGVESLGDVSLGECHGDRLSLVKISVNEVKQVKEIVNS